MDPDDNQKQAWHLDFSWLHHEQRMPVPYSPGGLAYEVQWYQHLDHLRPPLFMNATHQ